MPCPVAQFRPVPPSVNGIVPVIRVRLGNFRGTGQAWPRDAGGSSPAPPVELSGRGLTRCARREEFSVLVGSRGGEELWQTSQKYAQWTEQ